jgi:hypothetical protein
VTLPERKIGRSTQRNDAQQPPKMQTTASQGNETSSQRPGMVTSSVRQQMDACCSCCCCCWFEPAWRAPREGSSRIHDRRGCSRAEEAAAGRPGTTQSSPDAMPSTAPPPRCALLRPRPKGVTQPVVLPGLAS